MGLSELGVHSNDSLYQVLELERAGMHSLLIPLESQAVLMAVGRHINLLVLNQ